MGLLIAIDGPSGTGKGALSRELIQLYGFSFLDTGLLFRALALAAMHHHVPLDHEEGLVALAATLTLDDVCCHPDLRGEKVGQGASKIAVLPAVREALTVYMRQFAHAEKDNKGVVLDGRDIGTVVCPDADIKFYMTASAHTRAKRRFKELHSKDDSVIFETVLHSIQERDERDSHRRVAPLKPADDAIYIDTSEMTIADVVNLAKAKIDAAMS